MDFVVTELDVSTWDVFAELVERNNGVFGGCWCTAFQAEGTARGIDRRAVKRQRWVPRQRQVGKHAWTVTKTVELAV
jgi:hypothetical protein